MIDDRTDEDKGKIEIELGKGVGENVFEMFI